MSPTSALPSCEGSSLSGVESARATKIAPAISTTATAPRMIQSRFRDLRDEFNTGLQLRKTGSKLDTQSDSDWFPPSGVLPQHSQHLTLDAHIRGRSIDWGHFGVRGLQPDQAALPVEPLQRRIGAVH